MEEPPTDAPKRDLRKKRAKSIPAKSTPRASLNIAETLQRERSPITNEELSKQLDSLRPTSDPDSHEAQYISQSLFIKLTQKLLSSFNAQQLSHYYSVNKGIGEQQVGSRVLDGIKALQLKATRPSERSAWHPGTTQIDLRLPGLDVHHRRKRKHIGKHLLVDQVLRDLWKVVPLEEIETPGELELSLKSWQLALLDSGCMLALSYSAPIFHQCLPYGSEHNAPG